LVFLIIVVDAVAEIDDIDISDREAVDRRRIEMARDKLTNERVPRTQASAKRILGRPSYFNQTVKCARFGAMLHPVRNSLELPFLAVLRGI
jgi:hypothetical protein